MPWPHQITNEPRDRQHFVSRITRDGWNGAGRRAEHLIHERELRVHFPKTHAGELPMQQNACNQEAPSFERMFLQEGIYNLQERPATIDIHAVCSPRDGGLRMIENLDLVPILDLNETAGTCAHGSTSAHWALALLGLRELLRDGDLPERRRNRMAGCRDSAEWTC